MRLIIDEEQPCIKPNCCFDRAVKRALVDRPFSRARQWHAIRVKYRPHAKERLKQLLKGSN